MKILSRAMLNRAHPPFFVVALTAAACVLIARTPTTIAAQSFVPSKHGPFYVKSYGGKCLTYGVTGQMVGAAVPQRIATRAGAPQTAPVYIYPCNGINRFGVSLQPVLQAIVVKEINLAHDVVLKAGNQVIGVGGPLAEGSPLVLQKETDGARQVFALDGDSIILAANRDLVVEVWHNHGSDGTPLVLGSRNLDDSEFWDFNPTDGVYQKPTSGFVRIPQDTDFVSALQDPKWGTVIEIAAGTSIDLKTYPTQIIPAGVTIRGDRRGENLGPELYANYDGQNNMLEITGEAVRITGLRLRGPNGSTDPAAPLTQGIVAQEKFRSIIDNNELSNWTSGAIVVLLDELHDHRHPRAERIRILHNLIHHNERKDFAYGVSINEALPTIEGNVFVDNRHAIASGGRNSGYRARYNLVLFATPSYGFWNSVEHDFDMHGEGNSCDGSHCGGQAGDYMEIFQNTFLGGNRPNFTLRGTPGWLAEFHDNVLVGSYGDALENYCQDSAKFIVRDNHWEASNPTDRLAVGDFDGDGKEDLFLATGGAWYYAPAGNAEWRYLSSHTEQIDQLIFGDFDGDGRIDVFTVRGRDWLVSWGGSSVWEKINESPVPMADLTIGDFDGDHRADVFYANGTEWLISSGGVGPLQHFDTSGFRIPDLRFGDFNGDGKTDIFGITGNHWSVTYGGTPGWVTLPHTLTDSVGSLIVADFNGDGRADVVTFNLIVPFGIAFKVWYNGTADWTHLNSFVPQATVAGIGRFKGNRGVDLLLWHGLYLDISPGGTGTPQRQSRQDMR